MSRFNSPTYGMNYAERAAYRESRKGAIAAEKAKKAAKSMTCQCCGRQIFAQLGTIAHHGYERPGYGWQTASCMGAKELPFEVDRTRLADLIFALQDRFASFEADLVAIVAEKVKLPFTVTIDCEPRADKYGRRWEATTKEVRHYSRTVWQALVAAGEAEYSGLYSPPAHVEHACGDGKIRKLEAARTAADQVYRANAYTNYDKMKAIAIAQVEASIRSVKLDIKMSQDRYDGWKATHSHFNKETKQWVAL